MPSPLDQIKKQIAAGFKNRLKKGSLRKLALGAGVDALGDPVSGTATLYSFDGIREDFTAMYRAATGIPDTDVKILIIAGSLPAGIEPLQDDYVAIENAWYKIRKVLSIDPANATYTLQAFEAKVPV